MTFFLVMIYATEAAFMAFLWALCGLLGRWLWKRIGDDERR